MYRKRQMKCPLSVARRLQLCDQYLLTGQPLSGRYWFEGKQQVAKARHPPIAIVQMPEEALTDVITLADVDASAGGENRIHAGCVRSLVLNGAIPERITTTS